MVTTFLKNWCFLFIEQYRSGSFSQGKKFLYALVLLAYNYLCI